MERTEVAPNDRRRTNTIPAARSVAGTTLGGMVRSVVRQVLVAGVGAALLLQLGGWTRVEAQSSASIDVQAFAYQPTTMTVTAGTTVTWTNLDPVAHSVTDINQTWGSPLFDENASFSMTFSNPGTYTYFCLPHPTMIGTIEVAP